MSHPVLPYAEAWSSLGQGARARVGVVVSHGLTGNPGSVRPFAEGLAAKGFRVEAPRLPGHGTHWRDAIATRYSDWRAEIVATRDRLAKECDAVLVAGLSMGGTLALDVASAEPDRCAGAIAINPALLDREGVVAKLAPLIAAIFPAIPAAAAGLRKNDIAKAGGDERAYAWVPTRAASSMLEALPRIRAQLHGCKVPLLVAYAPQDHNVPPANARAVPGIVGPGGDVELLALERSYHVATLDEDLELLVEKSAAFIDAHAHRA